MKTPSPIQGVLSIDKPGGMSSHDVVNRLRRVCGIRRVGHAGTLDPLATGVLLVCVGRATRLVEYLVGQPKWYEATVRLGQTTNTYDADGEIVAERPFFHITPSQIAQELQQFLGPIQQLPPMYSAIKKDGQPLYKLARQGIEIARDLRNVTIYEIELLDCTLPDVQLRVNCSTGTYIRSLAHDLGETLGCGGHIATLRRTAIGKFGVETAVSLNELTEDNFRQYLMPMDTAVSHLPRVDFANAAAQQLLMGKLVDEPSAHAADTLVRAYDESGTFLGVLLRRVENWQARKMFPTND
ncbi:MAG: tRNA pseudouridine(55) synthase TruB [Chloroflexi bacterium]|nr:MAG: tRNA pseudouridine(55) synthase TruB [Chloroflexota bacterium]